MKIDITVHTESEQEAVAVLQKLSETAAVTLTPPSPVQTAPVAVELAASPNFTPPSPVQTAPVAPVQNGTVELDSEGLPWDARIHALTKTKTAKGAWKSGKNVSDELKVAVKAELRAATIQNMVPAQAPVVPAFVPPSPVAPAYADPNQQYQAQPAEFVQQYAPPAPAVPVAPVQQYAPLAPVAPVAPVQQVAPVQGVGFQQIMQKMQELILTKKVQTTYVNDLVGALNAGFGTQVMSITEINGNQPMMDYAYNTMAQIG